MAYKQSPMNFGVGTGSSPLNKNGDPVDENWTGKEEPGSAEELAAFRKDRNKALKDFKFGEAAKIQKDVKSSKKASKSNKSPLNQLAAGQQANPSIKPLHVEDGKGMGSRIGKGPNA